MKSSAPMPSDVECSIKSSGPVPGVMDVKASTQPDVKSPPTPTNDKFIGVIKEGCSDCLLWFHGAFDDPFGPPSKIGADEKCSMCGEPQIRHQSNVETCARMADTLWSKKLKDGEISIPTELRTLLAANPLMYIYKIVDDDTDKTFCRIIGVSKKKALIKIQGGPKLHIHNQLANEFAILHRLAQHRVVDGVPRVKRFEFNEETTLLETLPVGQMLHVTLGSLEDACMANVRSDFAKRFGGRLCSIVKALHGAGVVHRDINPSNIIKTIDEEYSLIDFGLAAVLGAPLSFELEFAGTHDYCRQRVSDRAVVEEDYYSVCATVYASEITRSAWHELCTTLKRPTIAEMARSSDAVAQCCKTFNYYPVSE